MVLDNLKEIGRLVSKVIDPNHQGIFGNTLLHTVVEIENSCTLIEKLINNGADVNMSNCFGITPLHSAVIHRNHSAIDTLIQSGALINYKTCSGNTALHYSINNSMFPVLHQNYTHLVNRRHFSDKRITRKLLQCKTLNLNATNNSGETPLMWAVACKDLDAVKDLLGKASNVNIGDCLKRTPLHIASSFPEPNLDIIFELLVHGASIYCFDNNHDTPADIIVRQFLNSKSDESVKVLAKIIVLMHEINGLKVPRLKEDFYLWMILKECKEEVQRMRNSIIGNDLSLFEFLYKGLNEKRFRNVENDVYTTIVETLISSNYSIYYDIIVKRIPKLELCKALVQLIISKNYLRGFKKENCLNLFSNLIVLYCLSVYLSSTDMFNIIMALFH